MAYEPLHHKYRPQTFADLVGQEAIATTLSNAMKTQRIAPAYLLTGARGTGKTSTARIMAKSLNCLSFAAPTATPCGKCEMCRGIIRGSALDITEIDAASNTGVDNIRDLIERSQFAPVQARYKVYAIDECLTGDSLVQTNDGLMRIDDPNIGGKQVLSYNEKLKTWEFKKVLRWLDRGDRQTLFIKTTNSVIQCTGNHLIRTDRGWIPAKDVREGMKILSPANAAVGHPFISTAQITESVDLPVDTNFVAINSEQSPTISQLSLNKLSLLDHFVPVAAVKNWKFQNFYNRKVEGLSVSNLVGQDIRIKKVMDFWRNVLQTTLISWESLTQKNWDSFMALYWGMDLSPIPTKIADFQGFAGHMELSNENGWSIKPPASQDYDQSSELQKIWGSAIHQFAAILAVILNLEMSLVSLSPLKKKNWSSWTGLVKLLSKAWLGGTWMMAHLLSQEIASQFICVLKDIQKKKIRLLRNGSQVLDILQKQNRIKNLKENIPTTLSQWTCQQVKSGFQPYHNTLSPQWHTNLETVSSIEIGRIERVYDIEVEDNHNFVANGLLLHNCHMLSTSAFNALLKTLEEPPDRVVFILATTDPQRVLPTIISRCQRFDFRRIPLEPMVQHLTKIAQIEAININPEALLLVGQMAQGGLRDAESLLDQLSLHEGEIKNETVWDLVGSVPERDLLDVLKAIATHNSVAVIEKIRQILDRGREPLTVLQSLAGFYRDLLIAKTAQDRSDLVALTSGTWTGLKEIAQNFAIESILIGQQHLRSAEVQIKNTTQPRLWLEITLTGLSNQALSSNVSPLTSTDRALTANVSPSTSTNQALSSNVSPSTSTNQALSSNVSPSTSTNQALSSNVSPLTLTNEALSSNVIPLTSTNEAPISSYQDLQDLNLAWQQLIKYLSPPSKAIFVNKAIFLEINDNNVVIGLKDKGLREIAVKKREELEKCSKQIFNRNVKVLFRFVSSDEVPTSTISATDDRPSYQAVSTTNSATNSAISYTVSSSERNEISDRPSSPVNKLDEITKALPEEPNLKTELKTPDLTELDERVSTRSVQPTEESAAIKNVVTFFDGQVIDLND